MGMIITIMTMVMITTTITALGDTLMCPRARSLWAV